MAAGLPVLGLNRVPLFLRSVFFAETFRPFLAETFWSLKHFDHLSNSGIESRHNSVFSLYFQTFWPKWLDFFRSFQKRFSLWPRKNSLNSRSTVCCSSSSDHDEHMRLCRCTGNWVCVFRWTIIYLLTRDCYASFCLAFSSPQWGWRHQTFTWFLDSLRVFVFVSCAMTSVTAFFQFFDLKFIVTRLFLSVRNRKQRAQDQSKSFNVRPWLRHWHTFFAR